MDFTPYSTVVVTPYKKGLRERVTRENIEDLYIPVIEDQLRRLARRMAYTIDKDCQTVIDAGATSSGAVTGKSLGATGTEFTVASSLGTKDILTGKAKIESYNFVPDSILINPVNARDVYYLPQFALYAQYGPAEGGSLTQSGKMGQIFGMDVYVSNVVPAGTAYMLSTGQNLSASYAPMGMFINGDSSAGEVKRPLLTDIEIKKEFDAVDVTLTTRYAPVILTPNPDGEREVLCGEALYKFTGLLTS